MAAKGAQSRQKLRAENERLHAQILRLRRALARQQHAASLPAPATTSPLESPGKRDQAAERVKTQQELVALNEALTRQTRQLRTLSQQLTLAEHRERQRLARVLHDHLQQLLVAAKLHCTPLHRCTDAEVRTAASEVSGLIREALAASRSLTAELCPPILYEGGLNEALQWLARWMHEKHGLEVEVAIEEPAVCLQEDVMILVFQAVRELLFNVTKHAGVNAASMGVCRAGDQIRITVVDNGAGFDPSALRSDVHLNGGFGLFNVRERLSHLGGCMEIDSAPGRGSRFTLAVPIGAPAAPPPVQVRVESAHPRRAARVPLTCSGRIRVLLVDDHAVTRQGLARLLREEPDMEVVAEAADGQAAIDLTRELLPHVVVMDVIMPGMPGIEATRRIHAEHPGVKIIALSMFDEAEHGAKLRKAGAVDYLTKTGPPEAVIAAIRAHAGRLPSALPIVDVVRAGRAEGPAKVGMKAKKQEVRSKK